MATPVLIIGRSGTGKSTTIAVVRNVIRIAIAGADGLMMCATSHRINSSRQLRM